MRHKKQANREPKKPKLAQQVRVLTPEEIQVLLNWDMDGVPHYTAAELTDGWETECELAQKDRIK